MAKVLILMSDTGGGHRASARALEAAFAKEYGEQFDVAIIDLWTDYTPWPINQLPKTYRPIVTYALWVWKFAWKVGERNWLFQICLRMVGTITRGAMRHADAEARDAVIQRKVGEPFRRVDGAGRACRLERGELLTDVQTGRRGRAHPAPLATRRILRPQVGA